MVYVEGCTSAPDLRGSAEESFLDSVDMTMGLLLFHVAKRRGTADDNSPIRNTACCHWSVFVRARWVISECGYTGDPLNRHSID